MRRIIILPVALTALIASLLLPHVSSSPYVISDDRVRNLDTTPVLGRGYSIMTNSFQSTCLDVMNTTVPSYNYDYTFYEFSRTTDYETELTSKLSYSFAYPWVKSNIASTYTSNTKTSTQTHYIVSTMRIERYYSSLREEHSPLSAPALQVLQSQDYVGFFKSCGPNYIRGIRRAQEVTAVFSFYSANAELARDYSSSVQVVYAYWGTYDYGSRYSSSTKFNAINKSLRISILGYGLGLTQEGSETLVATSLAEYQEVMKFAFNTMTRVPDAAHIGMVYGIEVVPWVENVAYQTAAGLQGEAIEVPLSRSMIPKAYRITDPSDTTFDNNARTDFKCKNPAYEMDKYGYCCEIGALFNTDEEEYDPTDPELRYCRPLRKLEKAIVDENMAQNAEFVARLDRMVRLKINQLNTLERCISAARAIPERYDYHILKSMDTVKYDPSIDVAFTVLELKMAIDPFNDYSMVTHMAREVDEYVEMFYQPCMNALYGTKIGSTSDTDPMYFMAYPWYTHKECLHLSCFGTGMRWDRAEGGCVPGLITGTTSANYNTGEDYCAKDGEEAQEDEICKYTTGVLDDFHSTSVSCWEETLPQGRIDYFMDHFCMPTVSNKKLSAEEERDLMIATTTHCRKDCMVLHFKTEVASADPWATSQGYFEIVGYGQVPQSCHKTFGAECSIRLCDMDTMEIRAKTTDWWAFTITGDIGTLLDYKTVTGGSHSAPFPTRLDTDQQDYYQKYSLNRRVVP